MQRSGDNVDYKLDVDSETIDAVYPAPPLVVAPSMPIRDVLALLKAERTGSLLVCDANRLVGIFTERDAVKLMARGADLTAPVSDVMTPDPITVRAGSSLGAAIRKMSDGGYRRLPIVDAKNIPLGMVKVSGIVRYLVEHFPQAVYNLPPEPNVVMQQREGA